MKQLKIIGTALCCLLLINSSSAQKKEEVLAEAYLLYYSEKASWHGTDIFLERFPEKRNSIGGYLSYSEGETHSCIFFDQSDNPNLLAKISFDNDFNLEKVKIDTVSRKLNTIEKDLFSIRKAALIEMSSDTMFKVYNNTNLNPIPLITKKERRVFVLTGPQVSGVVILGNDYLLSFDKKNKLKSKRRLHKNIIPIEYNEEMEAVSSMHSHLKSTGNLISSTDICTLMLYQPYTSWKQHIVISEKNVSIWDCETKSLVTLSRKVWDNMGDSEQ